MWCHIQIKFGEISVTSLEDTIGILSYYAMQASNRSGFTKCSIQLNKALFWVHWGWVYIHCSGSQLLQDHILHAKKGQYVFPHSLRPSVHVLVGLLSDPSSAFRFTLYVSWTGDHGHFQIHIAFQLQTRNTVKKISTRSACEYHWSTLSCNL